MALFDLENRGIPSWVEKLKVFTLRNTCCDKSTTKSYERQSLHQNLESYKVYRLWSVDESTESLIIMFWCHLELEWNERCVIWKLSYNLGQNKVEAMMKARRSKNAPFWHHWIGGRGGPGFPFIFVQDCNLGQNYPPSPQSNDEGAKEQKRAILASLNWGGGVVQVFHLFCPRL